MRKLTFSWLLQYIHRNVFEMYCKCFYDLLTATIALHHVCYAYATCACCDYLVVVVVVVVTDVVLSFSVFQAVHSEENSIKLASLVRSLG